MQTKREATASLDLLAELIKRPTISADSNLALIHYVRDFLLAHGIESHLVTTDDGRKANLYAVIGPRDVPGVMLSGHTDVVPVRGQPWTGDPFALRVEDGKAIGRGAVDMKGFIACALRCASLASQRQLKQPIVLALSHDEEIGCVGVRRMIPHLAALPARPFLCVVGEPTDMAVVTAHKGKLMGSIRCTGVDGHSSDPEAGVNAIFLAAEMIDALRTLQHRLQQDSQLDPSFEVPYSTVHVGVIHGGSVLNIIPRNCDVEFEIRTLPGIDQAELIEALQREAQRIVNRYASPARPADIVLTVHNAYPSLAMRDDDPGVYLAQRLSHRSGVGKVAFGSEAGLFQQALSIPVVVCGPGSVAQAHKPDEFVRVSQLDACDAFLERLLERLTDGTAHQSSDVHAQGKRHV